MKEKQGVISKEKEDFVFLSNFGKKLYPKLVYRVVNNYLSAITTINKKSPHVLRHTFATHMLNNGADLNAIKEILGHSNLSATQVYTHTTINKLKSIYKKKNIELYIFCLAKGIFLLKCNCISQNSEYKSSC